MSSVAPAGETPIHGLFSPEGVRLELPIAGPAPRMFAYGIDLSIIMLLIIGMAIALLAILPIGAGVERWAQQVFHEASRRAAQGNNGASMQFGAFGGALIALFVLGQFAVETGYFIFWEMVTNGRSPGKMLAGLRVVRRDGLPVDLKSSVLRNLLRIVDILPEYYVVGLVSMLLSPGGERLGDHVAGTIVIRLDRPAPAQELAASRNEVGIALTRGQLAQLGAPEIRLLRATLRRVSGLPEDKGRAILNEVAEAMKARLEIVEQQPTDPEIFLRELLTLAERYAHDAD
ncbi:MAG TPA: RDD family protein [Candidatus Binataceae bacterium]|nr:RDD family protein [Candidatus Binataceae bacterium]